MDEKLKICARYPMEMRFANMASRDMSAEIATDKSKIFMKYAAKTHATSSAVMKQALATLSLKSQQNDIVLEGILLYSNAIVSKYILIYQKTPDLFFKNAAQIKTEIKEFVDLMLYGIIKEETYEKA
jgi:TetR/AcrR family transcriptional regulator